MCLPLTLLVLLPIPVLLAAGAVVALAGLGLPGLVLGVTGTVAAWIVLRRAARAVAAWWRRAGQPSRS